MYQVFYGNDMAAVRGAAFAAVGEYENKGFTVETIEPDNYETGILNDKAGGSSLFGGATLYLLDTPSTRKDFYEDTVKNLNLLAESNNKFIIIESGLLAAEKKRFAKYAEEMEEFKSGPSDRFNVFSLADALARKDKKSLWLLFHEARLNQIAPEEIVGTLWWQLKTLRLAEVTNSAAEAGLKDFPYRKAKGSLSKFKQGEITAVSRSLLKLQHESRLGKRDLDIALERWVLDL